MKKDQSIIDKIQALLLRTEENGCTPAEVEEAAVAVERLLTKYALDLAEVAARGKQKKQPVDIIAHKFDVKKIVLDVNDQWWRSVVGSIARMMYCKPVVGGDWKTGYYAWVLGREVNAKAAESTILSVIAYGEREALREWDLQKESVLEDVIGSNARRTARREFFRSFLLGFSYGVARKSGESVKQQQADEKVTAIVAVDKEAIDQKVAETFGKLRSISRGSSGSIATGAFNKGAAAGQRSSVGQKELKG